MLKSHSTAPDAEQAIAKERPILFSGPMVRALLDGRKTQTRRIVKPVRGWEQHNICKPEMMAAPHEVWWHGDETDRVGVAQSCPYGAPGNRLWVREAFTTYRTETAKEQKQSTEAIRRFENILPSDNIVSLAKNFPQRSGPPKALYKADFGDWADDPDSDLGPWKPSIHMPRWASRITLELTGVRVERLLDITEADAQAEGAADTFSREKCPGFMDDMRYTATFASLWDSINGPGSWALNPWVWVLTFNRLERPQ